MAPNQVWAWDFVFDRTANGRGLKWFSIVDEYTRECLALEVGRSMTATDVIDVLVELEVFQMLAEARALATRWRLEYNHRRPHSSLGYVAPAAFAASLAEPPVATLPAAQPATEALVLS